MRVKAMIRRGRRDEATYVLSRLMKHMLLHTAVWIEAGWLWVELQRLDAAEACFRHTIELDADSAAAWQGLSIVHLRHRNNQAAIDAALEALQRLYQLPLSHLNLGIGLAREEQFEEAIVAFRRAIKNATGHGRRAPVAGRSLFAEAAG